MAARDTLLPTKSTNATSSTVQMTYCVLRSIRVQIYLVTSRTQILEAPSSRQSGHCQQFATQCRSRAQWSDYLCRKLWGRPHRTPVAVSR
eukprot:scaffold259099_cov35-Prasinocladus_malaysianus.AAC.3